jgi:UDP-N-acetylmuramyl tripeptide synthase
LNFTNANPVSVKGSQVYLNDSLIGETTLTGYFNEKNLNAALVSLRNLGIEPEESLKHLADVKLAFGRGEKVSIDGKKVTFYLAKNPASFNNNLDFIKDHLDCDTLVFALNDNIPDGRDVSWIYDINPEKISLVCENKNIYVTGKRSLDLAIRLKYANVKFSENQVCENLPLILKQVISDARSKNIVVFPNYSAMLDCRKVLLGRKIL